jgi:hypothetical protein
MKIDDVSQCPVKTSERMLLTVGVGGLGDKDCRENRVENLTLPA